jgi:hypothetical protein
MNHYMDDNSTYEYFFYRIALYSCFFLFRIIIYYKVARFVSDKTASGNLCLT